jgi:hypothetical protein
MTFRCLASSYPLAAKSMLLKKITWAHVEGKPCSRRDGLADRMSDDSFGDAALESRMAATVN